LVENLTAKVQNSDNFDNSHLISVSVQLATPLWSSMWKYHTFKHQHLGIIPVRLKTVAFSPWQKQILAKRNLHTSHNHMGLSYHPMKQIIIKLLANHKMLPNLYSTYANKIQKVWQCTAWNQYSSTTKHYITTFPTLHGEKLQTIVTPSITFKKVCTGLQPNLPLIAPSAILPTATALLFAHWLHN
jgi:hypothetical protein